MLAIARWCKIRGGIEKEQTYADSQIFLLDSACWASRSALLIVGAWDDWASGSALSACISQSSSHASGTLVVGLFAIAMNCSGAVTIPVPQVYKKKRSKRKNKKFSRLYICGLVNNVIWVRSGS